MKVLGVALIAISGMLLVFAIPTLVDTPKQPFAFYLAGCFGALLLPGVFLLGGLIALKKSKIRG